MFELVKIVAASFLGSCFVFLFGFARLFCLSCFVCFSAVLVLLIFFLFFVSAFVCVFNGNI